MTVQNKKKDLKEVLSNHRTRTDVCPFHDVMCACVHMWVFVCVRMCVHVCEHACLCTCMCTFVCTCVYVCVCVRMGGCVCGHV